MKQNVRSLIIGHAIGHDIMLIRKSFKAKGSWLQFYQGQDDFKTEMNTYSRIWNLEQFAKLPEYDIKSSGYVVDTLEAAVWCLLNTDNYCECVLKAVNLGGDKIL